MKPILDWVKINPVSIGAIFLVFVSVICLFIVNSSGANFVMQMKQRSNVIKHLESLQRTKVKIPPAKPDDPELELEVPVNQAAIDQLYGVYSRMNQEYATIFKLAVEFNQGDHVPMHEGIFPEPRDTAIPFEVREIYRRTLREMLGRPAAEAGYPRLNSDGPPTRGQIVRMLNKVEENYLANNFFPPKESLEELSEAQATQLNELKKQKLIDLLQDHAQSIHLYAETQIASPDFAFDVGEWSKPGPLPLMSQIWDGQVGLWIQQDLAEAIALSNHTGDLKASVINAPIKRLVKIRMVPGHSGLREGRRGLIGSRTRSGRRAGAANRNRVPAPLSRGGVDQRLPDNFMDSPTGRSSNAMYDVRHVEVSLIIDSLMIPVFLNSLQRVNFMTVLNMKVTAVDEYEALREGYVYGSNDVVQADMLIETIWLRDWTTKYMPESVRKQLGIEASRQKKKGT